MIVCRTALTAQLASRKLKQTTSSAMLPQRMKALKSAPSSREQNSQKRPCQRLKAQTQTQRKWTKKLLMNLFKTSQRLPKRRRRLRKEMIEQLKRLKNPRKGLLWCSNANRTKFLVQHQQSNQKSKGKWQWINTLFNLLKRKRFASQLIDHPRKPSSSNLNLKLNRHQNLNRLKNHHLIRTRKVLKRSWRALSSWISTITLTSLQIYNLTRPWMTILVRCTQIRSKWRIIRLQQMMKGRSVHQWWATVNNRPWFSRRLRFWGHLYARRKINTHTFSLGSRLR